jgi:TatD DNase family protein
MKLIDTHTHLYLPEFDVDRDEAIARAVNIGITNMLMPNIDILSVDQMLHSESKYPGICMSMIGLHPTSVKEDYLSQLDILEEKFFQHHYVAIGEIGIDLYWDKTFLDKQVLALRRQISFAVERKLPVVIHARDAFPQVFSVLDEFRGTGLKGVLHAFTGTIEDASKAIDLGFKLGIGGIVTFKNSGLQDVVKEVGTNNIVLETDSPYLAPVPYRGKRNESSYLCLVNKKISEILGMSEEDVASATYAGSVELFNLSE